MFERKAVSVLVKRLSEPRRFMQVLIGPRQTGKTTIARQAIGKVEMKAHYASADEPSLKSSLWLEQQWETARTMAKNGKFLLVIDEVQKVPEWSEKVKRLWDEDTALGREIFVMLLGSSPLLVQKGLSESLAGRFETIRVAHWSYTEMRTAFGWEVEQYIYFGGYPGSAALIEDPLRWTDYIRNSLIETTISRDILLMQRVDKPALLRRLFELGCTYSGQILSYQKMLGQLQDAGNTTTLAHYIDLLEAAGMLKGLQKYSGARVRRRASSPKFQALNNALVSAQRNLTFEDVKADPQLWGRLFESAVGAHLANAASEFGFGLFYWRESNKEVDFVLESGKRVVAIEVKSGRSRSTGEGSGSLIKRHMAMKNLLVGEAGIPVVEFLSLEPMGLFE